MSAFVTLERGWVGETVVCLGTGPSLSEEDVAFVRGKARVICINNSYKLAPWADVMYAADEKFWGWVKGAPDFSGRKITIEPQRKTWPGLEVVRKGDMTGLSHDPAVLNRGYNSGYQAINLAVLMGASTVILLGYDMTGGHYFGRHPDGTLPPFALCLHAFSTLPEPLSAAGVTVINCTANPASPLTVFPRMPLSAALARRAA